MYGAFPTSLGGFLSRRNLECRKKYGKRAVLPHFDRCSVSIIGEEDLTHKPAELGKSRIRGIENTCPWKAVASRSGGRMTTISAFSEKLHGHDGHVSSSRVSLLEFRQISRHETSLYERKSHAIVDILWDNKSCCC